MSPRGFGNPNVEGFFGKRLGEGFLGMKFYHGKPMVNSPLMRPYFLGILLEDLLVGPMVF